MFPTLLPERNSDSFVVADVFLPVLEGPSPDGTVSLGDFSLQSVLALALGNQF